MKLLIALLFVLLSSNTYALTSVNGHFNKKNNILSIRLKDYGFAFPYEAGDLYNEMKGFDQSEKSFNRNGVQMECDARRVSGKGNFGDCKIELDGSLIKVGTGGYYIFKLKGQSAFEIFREFHSIKSFRFSNATAYITMIQGRNEFYVGIKTSAVEVER